MSCIDRPAFPAQERSVKTAVGWEMHLIFVTRLATKESQEYCVARVFHAGQKSNALCESWPPEPYGAQT